MTSLDDCDQYIVLNSEYVKKIELFIINNYDRYFNLTEIRDESQMLLTCLFSLRWSIKSKTMIQPIRYYNICVPTTSKSITYILNI